MGWFRRVSTGRPALRLLYDIWVAFPYSVRKPPAAADVFWVLPMKKVAGVNRQNRSTPVRSPPTGGAWWVGGRFGWTTD
jgi:hypothetical protein